MTTVTRARLWSGLVLAPAAWLLGELVGYYFAARSCEAAPPGVPFPGTSHPASMNLVIEGVAFLVAATGLFIAASSWQATRYAAQEHEPAALGRAHFMAFTGIVVSGLFMLGIALFGVTSFVINVCSQTS